MDRKMDGIEIKGYNRRYRHDKLKDRKRQIKNIIEGWIDRDTGVDGR